MYSTVIYFLLNFFCVNEKKKNSCHRVRNVLIKITTFAIELRVCKINYFLVL